jgi:hypothetical protein
LQGYNGADSAEHSSAKHDAEGDKEVEDSFAHKNAHTGPFPDEAFTSFACPYALNPLYGRVPL